MPLVEEIRFNADMLVPVFPDSAKTHAVEIAPNLTLSSGQVLGHITSASTAEVQKIDFGGTVSGGTFTLTAYDKDGNAFASSALDYNISNANIKIAIEDLLEAAGYVGATVTISGGASPTDVNVTYGGTVQYRPMPLLVADGTSLTGTNPTVAVTRTTTGFKKGTYAAYNDSNNNGTEVAKCLLQVGVKTNCLGEHVYGSVSHGEHGQMKKSAPVFYRGDFKCGDLTGLDANGAADLGRLFNGAYSDSDTILVM